MRLSEFAPRVDGMCGFVVREMVELYLGRLVMEDLERELFVIEGVVGQAVI